MLKVHPYIEFYAITNRGIPVLHIHKKFLVYAFDYTTIATIIK